MIENFHEGDVNKWFAKYGWRSNPFTFKIYSKIMVGYKNQIEELVGAINANNSFSLVIGETGAGKTNLLNWISNQSNYKNSAYYLPNPPATNNELFQYIKKEILKPGLFSRLFKNISPYNLHYELQKKSRKRILVIIDEAHEAPIEVLRWIRTVIDYVENLSVIAAGLPELVDTLKEKVSTLYDRATTILKLENLNKDETLELIQKRIFAVGGKNLEPFTQEALIKIYEKSRGFPREVLRLCNQAVLYAIRNNKFLIDLSCVTDSSKERKYSSKKIDLEDTELTEKQKIVLELLLKHGKLHPHQIVQNLGLEGYKSESHAIRSVNNILKRLLQNRIVEREKSGRTYFYFVREDAKKILS